ncbi:MAG: SDR family NAD(P)-dependent oxidoreductase [Thermocrispum sp.]
MTTSSAVLITGCSSGVGRAAALRFLRSGRPVYATARDIGTATDLTEAGAVVLPLDVTDEESSQAAVERVEADHGAVGVLVNNAAYGLQGAIETVPLDQARALFETNLFGTVRLTQLALPAMRAAGGGRVVNVSAMGGHICLPGTGVLHASKHAVRAISRTLRMELRLFGIHVSAVEPGPISTPFAVKANATFPPPAASGAYRRFHTDVAARLEAAYQPRAANLVLSPEAVARAIERAARAARPRARYPVGAMSRTLVTLNGLLPEAALDAVVRSRFPVPVPVPAERYEDG